MSISIRKRLKYVTAILHTILLSPWHGGPRPAMPAAAADHPLIR
jgi:hypothetical protein